MPVDQGNEAGVTLPIAQQVGQTLDPATTAQIANAGNPSGQAVTAPVAQTNGTTTDPTQGNLDPGAHKYVLPNGGTVQSAAPLSGHDLDHIIGQTSKGAVPANQGWKDVTNDPGLVDNTVNAGAKAVGTLVEGGIQNAGALASKAAQAMGDDRDSQSIDDFLKASQDRYNARMGQLPTDDIKPTDIHNAYDAAKWAGQTAAESLPYIGAYAVGGPLAAIGVGGATRGEEALTNTGGNKTAMALGDLTGAATAAVPVPFIGGSTLTRQLLRGALGGGAASTVGTTLENVPEGLTTTGNPFPNVKDYLPNLITGGAIGAVANPVASAIGEGADAAAGNAVDVTGNPKLAQARADDAVADRLNAQKDTAPLNNEATAKVAIDNSINEAQKSFKANAGALNDRLDPAQATSFQDAQDRAQLQSTMQDVMNRVTGRVSEPDLVALNNAVGDTQEGRIMLDAARQLNTLKDLRTNLTGGVSKITDLANPLKGVLHPGSFAEGVGAGTRGLLTGGAYLAHPGIAATGLGAFATGRAIDALTGNRWPVAKFANQNGNAAPIDMTGARSVFDDKASAAAQAQADVRAKASQDQLNAQRQQDLRMSQFQDNNPGVNGFNRSVYDQTGLGPQQAARGVFELARQGTITPAERNAWFKSPKDLMDGNVGNMIIDHLDGMARKGLIDRDPDWKATTPNPSSAPAVDPLRSISYAASAKGNQDRITASMGRVANNGTLTPQDVRAVNNGLAAIGRTNNRADASQVMQQMVRTASPAAQKVALTEATPLVRQIAHATPMDAAKARRNDVAIAKAGAARFAQGVLPSDATLTTLLGDQKPVFMKAFQAARKGMSDTDAMVAAFHTVEANVKMAAD